MAAVVWGRDPARVRAHTGNGPPAPISAGSNFFQAAATSRGANNSCRRQAFGEVSLPASCGALSVMNGSPQQARDTGSDVDEVGHGKTSGATSHQTNPTVHASAIPAVKGRGAEWLIFRGCSGKIFTGRHLPL